MEVFLLIDDLIVIFGYILGLMLMLLFEYKVVPKIGNTPNEKNFFYKRFKFAQLVVLFRILYLIYVFLKKFF